MECGFTVLCRQNRKQRELSWSQSNRYRYIDVSRPDSRSRIVELFSNKIIQCIRTRNTFHTLVSQGTVEKHTLVKLVYYYLKKRTVMRASSLEIGVHVRKGTDE